MGFAFCAPVMSTPSPALFAARCLDKPESSATRMATRTAHLEWIGEQVAKFRFAGPLRKTAGASPVGSLLVMQLPDENAVSSLLDVDPYVNAGLFQDVETRRWICGMATNPPLPTHIYAIWCVDKKDSMELRKETRPRHLEWWKAAGRQGMIGPFPQEGGAVGTLIVCGGDSLEEVEQWAKTDPYNEVGLFESVDVYAVQKIVEGGEMFLG